ncbi:hypothetical protein PAXRUDRAFT_20078 [Paxillus rubicundulus Ve08.2h10]|uniref:Uncharacterized protein n=1 Tax=Paxillus rubicundulus Ve08.2h10 TaxID=930991 RepID=A0A0D0CT96_9AGAM|nr:hypothetical protein PAXRUDRAFT_20078 [Paxillus rubicundulus Ve08.2h10]
MGMIQWTQELVARHPWAQQGTIIQMEYEFGDSSSNNNEVSQPLKEPMGAEEEEVRGAQILQMKTKEDNEEDVVMTTTNKAARPKQMMEAQWAAGRRDDVQSEDEDPIGNVVVGSTSSADRMTAMPTPAPQSTPLRTPIPVPNPTQ